jgi:hypothetical protein
METAVWQFLAAAAICFTVVGIALYTGRVPGVAWRGRFIARRESEPKLYGCSLAIFAAFGAFLVIVVISTR